MKPFKPNQQQLEALNNGAAKLWFPMDDDLNYVDILSGAQPSSIAAFASEMSPLQPNEQYFVPQKVTCMGECNMGQACQCCGSNGQYIGTVEYMPVSCSIKFTTTNVEVKYAQDLTLREMVSLGIKNETAMTERFVPWHDTQYPDQPYSSKPVGFLVSIERI